MDIEPKEVGGIIVTLITAVGAWLGGMRHGKAEFINAVHAAADKVITRLDGEVERLSKKCEIMEAKYEKCEVAHAECKDDLAMFRREMEDYMSANPPANY